MIGNVSNLPTIVVVTTSSLSNGSHIIRPPAAIAITEAIGLLNRRGLAPDLGVACRDALARYCWIPCYEDGPLCCWMSCYEDGPLWLFGVILVVTILLAVRALDLALYSTAQLAMNLMK